MVRKKITFDLFVRGVFTGIVIIFVLYLINKLSGVLLPFFIAWLIAYLLYPFVKFFQYKLRLRSRILAIIMVMLLFMAIFELVV